MPREAGRMPNSLLRAAIRAAGVTYETLAATVRMTVAEAGEVLRTNRSAVALWVAGAEPTAARYLAEALSRHLGRAVSVGDIGLAARFPAAGPGLGCGYADRAERAGES